MRFGSYYLALIPIDHHEMGRALQVPTLVEIVLPSVWSFAAKACFKLLVRAP